jgi:4-diphosphocytidyl-2C-methyl-D-erythritol kinase
VTGSPPATIAIDAPAKLNLGLEVLGRREDGFHEIATIFLAIDLHDSLTLTSSDRLILRSDDPRLSGEENLILRALRELRGPSPPTPSPVEPGEGERASDSPSPCAQGEGVVVGAGLG